MAKRRYKNKIKTQKGGIFPLLLGGLGGYLFTKFKKDFDEKLETMKQINMKQTGKGRYKKIRKRRYKR